MLSCVETKGFVNISFTIYSLIILYILYVCMYVCMYVCIFYDVLERNWFV